MGTHHRVTKDGIVIKHQVVTIDGTDDQWSFLVHHDIDVFPQSTHSHTHAHMRTHTHAHTRAPLYLDGFSSEIDLIDPKGLLFHDQRFPLVCFSTFCTRFYGAEKTTKHSS